MTQMAQIVIGCLALTAAAAASQPSGAPQQTQPQAASQEPQSANSGQGEEVFRQNCFVAIRSRKDFRPADPGRLLCTCVCGPASAIPT